MKIEQGQIWQVRTDSFIATPFRDTVGGRKVLLKHGEYIEIRFPYAWHFRTEDNLYLHASPEDISLSCSYVGKIWHKVSFRNKAELSEILKLKLYE